MEKKSEKNRAYLHIESVHLAGSTSCAFPPSVQNSFNVPKDPSSTVQLGFVLCIYLAHIRFSLSDGEAPTS